jgi:hypothetical protein
MGPRALPASMLLFALTGEGKSPVGTDYFPIGATIGRNTKDQMHGPAIVRVQRGVTGPCTGRLFGGAAVRNHRYEKFLIGSKFRIAGFALADACRPLALRAATSLRAMLPHAPSASRNLVRVMNCSGSRAMGPRLHQRLAVKPAHAPQMPDSQDKPTWLTAG